MSNEPMVTMSRAIRHAVEDQCPGPGGSMAALPDEALEQFAEIVGAYAADLRDERERRAAAKEASV